MADDPYTVLGVAHSASDEEIRRAYLKLVKELHPDVNPQRAAHERFKKVTAAHDIIGDPERRRKFDRGEIDANGEPRRTQARAHAGPGYGGGFAGGTRGFSGFDSDDIMSDIFGAFRAGQGSFRGRETPQRGADVRYTLEIEFLEAAVGARKRVTMPGGGALDLNVPEGVEDGQVLRLRGKGQPGHRGGEPGDALVEIKVRPHPLFKRQGDDVVMDLPVTIDEAVLGARIEVPTLSGRVQLTVPKGTSSGQVLRLKGLGVRRQGSAGPGDLLAMVRIVLPPTVDENLSYFLTEWRQTHKYDPGRRS